MIYYNVYWTWNKEFGEFKPFCSNCKKYKTEDPNKIDVYMSFRDIRNLSVKDVENMIKKCFRHKMPIIDNLIVMRT